MRILNAGHHQSTVHSGTSGLPQRHLQCRILKLSEGACSGPLTPPRVHDSNALFRVEAMDCTCTAPDHRTRPRHLYTPHLGAPVHAIIMGDVNSNLVKLGPHSVAVAVRHTLVSPSRFVEEAGARSIKLWHGIVSIPRWNCTARLMYNPVCDGCVTLL